MMKRLPSWGLGTLVTLLLIRGAAAAPVPLAAGRGDIFFRSFEDDAGGFYLAWVQNENDKSLSLRAQHINTRGQLLWGTGGLLVAARLASAEDWSGLADGQGGLTLFWDESDGVHAQRF